MNETDALLTTAIVGGPRRYVLGVLTTEAVQGPASAIWPIAGKLSWLRARPAAVVTSAIAVTLACACAFVMTRPGQSGQTASNANPVAVRVPLVPASAIPATAPAAIALAASPFPLVQSRADEPPVPTIAAVSPAALPPLPAPQRTITAPPAAAKLGAASDSVKAAVVLDATTLLKPAPSTMPAATSLPQPPNVAQGRVVSPVKESAPVPGASTQLRANDSSAASVTIVDIEKSGAFALVTNPQTRLPEKVAVGQKIFTGETVKRIDAGGGKVFLDTRTINMQ